MDFSLTDEQKALQDTARRFVREELGDLPRAPARPRGCPGRAEPAQILGHIHAEETHLSQAPAHLVGHRLAAVLDLARHIQKINIASALVGRRFDQRR